MEHIGNELGINSQPTSNISVSSDSDNDHVENPPDREVSSKLTKDRFRKRKFQSTSINNFFHKQPRTPASDSQIFPVSTEGSSYIPKRQVKQWKDPQMERDKKRRKLAVHSRYIESWSGCDASN